MRILIAFATLAVSLAPAAALAATDSDTKNVGITGTVSRLCVLGEPSTTLVNLGQMAETSGARVGKLTAIANQTVTLPNSFCNFANSSVTVEATALKAADATTPPTGFARAINYTATASGWAATNAAAATSDDGNGGSAAVRGIGSSQPTPKLSDITLALSGFAVSGDKLLVSGSYNTTVTITLAPSPAS